MHGIVFDSDGKPLAGAEITVMEMGVNPLYLTANAQGQFTFAPLGFINEEKYGRVGSLYSSQEPSFSVS